MSQEKTERIMYYSLHGIILLGVLAAVALGLLTLNRLSRGIRVLEKLSDAPAATPISIVLRPMAEPTSMPRPTRTPYPTFTPRRTWPSRAASRPPSPPVTPTPQPTSSPTPMPPRMPLPFEDSFDAGPRHEWEPVRGTWIGVDGAYTAAPATGWSLTLVGNTGWADYAIDVDVVFQLSTYPIRIVVRALDGSYMALETDCCNTYWILGSKAGSRPVAHSARGALTYDGDRWSKRHLRIEVRGDAYSAYVDDVPLLATQMRALDRGRVGLGLNCPIESMPRFEDLRIAELH